MLAKIFSLLILISFPCAVFSQSNDDSLIEATKDGNIEKVKYITKLKTNLNQEDLRLMTPLMIACNDNNIEIVKILLSAGADVNRKHRENGRNALMYASINGYQDLVKLILTVPGILINAKDKDGKTALMHSVFNARKDTVSVLIEAGANVNSRSNSEDSALGLALRGGRAEIVSMLKQSGARE